MRRVKYNREQYLNDLEIGFSAIVKACQLAGYSSKEDLSNFSETPKRAAKGFCELVKPLEEVKIGVAEALSKNFPSKVNSMVLSANNIVFSVCPHHLLPVTYRVHVAYMPKKGGIVLGVSKLTRISELLSARPVLQETFASDLANSLFKSSGNDHQFHSIESDGSAVIVEGTHGCMTCRGVKQQAVIVVSEVRGNFIDNSEIKSEFMSLVQLTRKGD